MSFHKGRKRAVPAYKAAERGVMVPAVNVKAIRLGLGLSQTKFAARFGFAPASVRNWEQGRRIPDGPARILLAVIGEYPGMVESVLRKLGVGAR